MSEKLYLPVSILLSALILSGTMFLGFGAISEKLATGLVVAGGAEQTGNGGGIQVAPTPVEPTVPVPTATASLSDLAENSHLVYGQEGAPIQIIEFSDFECPFCGSAHPTVKALMQEYDGQIEFRYAHFPLSFHPRAKPSALASECAAEQGKFSQYHDKLFENQTRLDDASLKQYAADLGLNTQQFNQCLDSAKYNAEVDEQFSLGSTVGVSGTPTFLIGKSGETIAVGSSAVFFGQTGRQPDGKGGSIVGARPLSDFKSVVDSLLS